VVSPSALRVIVAVGARSRASSTSGARDGAEVGRCAVAVCFEAGDAEEVVD
jgi:hypothetical protein